MYFKIYGLCFLRDALCFFSVCGSVGKRAEFRMKIPALSDGISRINELIRNFAFTDKVMDSKTFFDFVSASEAREAMNRLGAQETDFVFVIDYLRKNCVVVPLAEVNVAQLCFDFPNAQRVGHRNVEDTARVVWQPQFPPYASYERAFECVRSNILRGNSYLVNLTAEIEVKTNLTLQEIFYRSHAPYRLWMNNRFVCFSPETFVRIDAQGTISSYPMKGTIDATIRNAAEVLENDGKEAAEHATIVDLIRNDLSIVADKVHVERYRYLDLIETNRGRIFQTSSEVAGRLHGCWQSRLGDIVFSQLPAGSITGAPKPETMRIIADAENYERGFYTGVMGCYAGGKLDSAVMIRFAETREGKLFFKAGGGITSKSECRKEYEELKQKVYVPFC